MRRRKGVIAIRADIDAIQLTEQGDWSYRSMTAERMHGCGHDGHTCIALGAAQLLLQRQNFNGTVCFVFQPAEEPGYGARAMMDDGVIERFGIEEIYGLHNMPGMKAGTIATRVGGIMASEDNFIIRIKGQERMRRGRIWRKIRWSLRRKSSRFADNCFAKC